MRRVACIRRRHGKGMATTSSASRATCHDGSCTEGGERVERVDVPITQSTEESRDKYDATTESFLTRESCSDFVAIDILEEGATVTAVDPGRIDLHYSDVREPWGYDPHPELGVRPCSVASFFIMQASVARHADTTRGMVAAEPRHRSSAGETAVGSDGDRGTAEHARRWVDRRSRGGKRSGSGAAVQEEVMEDPDELIEEVTVAQRFSDTSEDPLPCVVSELGGWSVRGAVVRMDGEPHGVFAYSKVFDQLGTIYYEDSALPGDASSPSSSSSSSSTSSASVLTVLAARAGSEYAGERPRCSLLPLLSPLASHPFPPVASPPFPPLLPLLSPPCFPSFPPLLPLLSPTASPPFPHCFPSFPPLFPLLSRAASHPFPNPIRDPFPPVLPLISPTTSPPFLPSFPLSPTLLPLIFPTPSPPFPHCVPSFPPLQPSFYPRVSPTFPPCFHFPLQYRSNTSVNPCYPLCLIPSVPHPFSPHPSSAHPFSPRPPYHHPLRFSSVVDGRQLAYLLCSNKCGTSAPKA
ncbi:unnamed protein product [Closterium sp. Naga37s-1]|nr:unnamed protein product [Closterium sp. Naga37s-1]